VALTVNGTQIASASFSSTSTSATIAAALVSAASSNTLATVVPSATKSNELQMTAIGSGTHTNYTYALSVAYNTSTFSAASFAGSPSTGSFVGGSGVPLYNWAISSYAPNGDVLQMTDSVMGSWTYTYDAMNRLTSGTATGGADDGLTLSWAYDRYGNRWSQTATGTGYASAVQPQLTFNGSNGVQTNRIDGWTYDNAGNLLNDKIHTYTYDAENRIATIGGSPAYIYDAEGRRVAKTNSSGAATSVYILGLGGEQVTELNSSGAWVHTNVFAGGGRLLASYEGPAGTDTAGYHYHLTDWLGTKRMQTTASGNQEETCMSYPFGDGLACTGGPDATEHHFTGKERDTESGLDYFFARYFTSDLARFMTPDWAGKPIAVPYASFRDPQSLNLYEYVGNNPNTGIDLDGHLGGDNSDSITGLLNGGGSEAGGSDGDSFAAIEQYHAAATNPSGATTDSGKSIGGEPAPSNPDPKDPVGQQQALGEAPPSGGSGKPTNQTVDPAPTGPDGKPSPPAVPVPGCPTCKWVWAPNGQNSRGGTWVPDNYPPTPGANPKASWDTGSRGGPGHWDVKPASGPTERYYPDGRPMPEDVAHPPWWRPIWRQIVQGIPNLVS